MGWVDAGQRNDVFNDFDHLLLNEEDSIAAHHRFRSFRIFEKLNKSGRLPSADGLHLKVPKHSRPCVLGLGYGI